jgi:transcriptional regulator
MYLPAPFRESDRGTLYDFIEAHPLGVITSPTVDGGLYATHLPLWLDRERGVLEGHVARANPHSARTASGTGALVVFSGVDAYITPSFYPSKQEHGKTVPTWNYIAVHVEGPLTWYDDVAFLRRHLDRLTTTHEAHEAHPWAMDDAPADFLAQQMRGIIGVSIAITSLEGKYKLSQNRSDADISGVVDGLRLRDTNAAHAMADAVSLHRPAR